MSSVGLPPPWLSYKTQDGKEYFYNPQTKVTTWDRPAPSASKSSSASSSKHTSSSSSSQSATASTPSVSSMLPAGAADPGRGNLLASIRQGTKLKKAPMTRESSPLDAIKSTPSSHDSGGGGMDMMAAIRAGGNLKKTSSASTLRNSGPPSGLNNNVSSGGGGGFAEIMRKNREAAARKGSNSSANSSTVANGNSVAIRKPIPSYSSSAPSTPHGHEQYDQSGGSRDEQLASIEAKLDKIMAHLGIN